MTKIVAPGEQTFPSGDTVARSAPANSALRGRDPIEKPAPCVYAKLGVLLNRHDYPMGQNICVSEKVVIKVS